MKPIRFRAAAWQSMISAAEGGYPHEVVGILVGNRHEGIVDEVVPLFNERADSPENRYRVSGLVLARAEAAVEERGKEIVGYYHSHPDHPARYSRFDCEHALPTMAYPILSIREGKLAEAQLWWLTEAGDEMQESPLIVADEPDSNPPQGSP